MMIFDSAWWNSKFLGPRQQKLLRTDLPAAVHGPISSRPSDLRKTRPSPHREGYLLLEEIPTLYLILIERERERSESVERSERGAEKLTKRQCIRSHVSVENQPFPCESPCVEPVKPSELGKFHEQVRVDGGRHVNDAEDSDQTKECAVKEFRLATFVQDDQYENVEWQRNADGYGRCYAENIGKTGNLLH